MHEAANLLLGEHLYEKSDAVKWLSVDHHGKRKRVLKNYTDIKVLHKVDLELKDVFTHSLITVADKKVPISFVSLSLNGKEVFKMETKSEHFKMSAK